MTRDSKAVNAGREKLPEGKALDMPAIGMESEFNVFIDGEEIVPEKYWRHPSDFIDVPMLKRPGKSSSQLPSGGAVYFDRGVIEVVTPLVEIAPGCTARVVRSLWEQIAFVREQLTRWERRTNHNVRLRAYSSHFNVSFELEPHEQNRFRNAKRLALLLAYILPVPVMLVAANRRSTGVGVRPRGNRIEITLDFTPDPGLMIATATLIVGIVREVMSWPSYKLSLLRELPIPTIAGVIPGKHTTRKGWLTKDFHYQQSPYVCDVDEPIWKTLHGETLSLRAVAFRTASYFASSIRRSSDPFSFRLLFAVLEGRAPSLLDLKDRPAAYEDIGRLCRWGRVIHELQGVELEQNLKPVRKMLWPDKSIEEHMVQREIERRRFSSTHPVRAAVVKNEIPVAVGRPATPSRRRQRVSRSILEPAVSGRIARIGRAALARRSTDATGTLLPDREEYLDRRARIETEPAKRERRRRERRTQQKQIPFPDRRLTRSAYESVFLKLVSGQHLRIGRETYTPIGMKGWYHAIFRCDSDGRRRLLSIDQLVRKMNDWG